MARHRERDVHAYRALSHEAKSVVVEAQRKGSEIGRRLAMHLAMSLLCLWRCKHMFSTIKRKIPRSRVSRVHCGTRLAPAKARQRSAKISRISGRSNIERPHIE